MKIHHFAAAPLCPSSRRLVNGEGRWREPGRLVCHCWLIESNDGLILVDTGIGTVDLADVSHRLGPWFDVVARPERGEENTALGQVKALGYSPKDVRHIVPTHLDLDHAGGLPDFPDAVVHVFGDEHAAAMAPASLRERVRYRSAHWRHQPHWDVRDARTGDGWFGFDSVHALDATDDILLIPLVGHTRGHCGVAVRTRGGWKLHAGDAYFFHGEMAATPWCSLGLAAFQHAVAEDDRTRLKNRARLNTLANTETSVELYSAHCPVELERACAAQP